MKLTKILSIAVLCAALTTFATAGSDTNKGTTPNGKPFVKINELISEIANNTTSLQEQIDGLITRVETLEEKELALETMVANLKEANVILQETMLQSGDLAVVQEAIDENKRLIELLQTELEGINASLALKQNIISGTCPNGELVTEVTEDSITCSTLNTTPTSKPQIYYSTIHQFVPAGEKPVYFQMSTSCEPGDLATGGGFIKYSPSLNIRETYGSTLHPNNAIPELLSYWIVKGDNHGRTQQTVMVRATCLKFN